jgi:hypothetical protein
VPLGERPAHASGTFDQEVDFLQQRGVDPGPTTGLLRRGFGLPPDQRLPCLSVRNDVSLLKLAEVALGGVENHFAGVQKAVAAGAPAGVNVGHLEAHLFSAVERRQPADRPGKAHREIGPTHGLGEGELADQLGPQVGEHLGCRTPLFGHLREDEPPFPGLADLQILNRHAAASGKALTGLGRLAILREGLLRGRALDFVGYVGLLPGDLPDNQGQSPWRAVGADLAEVQAVLLEPRSSQLPHLSEGRQDDIRRDLLDSDLKKGCLSHHAVAPSSAAFDGCWSGTG